MTDPQINYQSMALNVLQLLTANRGAWEPIYPKLLVHFMALQTALDSLDTKARQRGGTSSTGYTDAKDLAEVATLDAAMPVVQGLKALYQDGEHPALATVAGHTRSALDDLRGLTQVAALENIYTVALPLATELADELVTAEQLQALHDRTAKYKPLVGTPRQQTNSGVVLHEDVVQHLAEARAALDKLDVRVPNLQSTLPKLVAEYEQTRFLVNAGHGGGAKPAAGTPPAPGK